MPNDIKWHILCTETTMIQSGENNLRCSRTHFSTSTILNNVYNVHMEQLRVYIYSRGNLRYEHISNISIRTECTAQQIYGAKAVSNHFFPILTLILASTFSLSLSLFYNFLCVFKNANTIVKVKESAVFLLLAPAYHIIKCIECSSRLANIFKEVCWMFCMATLTKSATNVAHIHRK